VLVVDDEEAVCDVIATVLEQAGYSVEKAVGGQEALEKIRRRPPALVILDMMMPGMSGCEVYEALRRDRLARDIPVVITSAGRDVLASLRELGASGRLAKPFLIDDLVRLVEKCLPSRPSRQLHRSIAQPLAGQAAT